MVLHLKIKKIIKQTKYQILDKDVLNLEMLYNLEKLHNYSKRGRGLYCPY